MTPVLLWLRQDLRLHDQPALLAAAGTGAVIPVYVLDDESPRKWRVGAAQRWWLHHSLAALDLNLRELGSRLVLRRGRSEAVLRTLLAETGATEIHALRHYEPWWRLAETALDNALVLHDGNHLAPIEEITTGTGGLFKVYSAFWKALSQRMPPEEPWPAPETILAPAKWPESDALADWALLPTKPDWSSGFSGWTPGEAGAADAIEAFRDVAKDYDVDRNLPSIEGSSRLSPHLHFGEVSPRQVWHGVGGKEVTFRKELAWRDFARGVILDRPGYGDINGRAAFNALKWRDDAGDLCAWQTGRTGYPIVDAGMRQLWATGWMHNRVRMIVASFLTKHLLIDWRSGERWFWDTLLDADYGSNAVNWQWVSGTGVDANMWGRIMAPLSQSVKFDATGYIREWVPELAGLSDEVIHDPDDFGVRPSDYPAKIVGHRAGRERAIAAGKNAR